MDSSTFFVVVLAQRTLDGFPARKQRLIQEESSELRIF